MKVRRSDRLIDMTRYLLERPHTLISLTYFARRFDSAKSSLSEDLTILKRTFHERGTGILETVPGAAGGARFIPSISKQEAEQFVKQMASSLSEQSQFYLADMFTCQIYLADQIF